MWRAGAGRSIGLGPPELEARLHIHGADDPQLTELLTPRNGDRPALEIDDTGNLHLGADLATFALIMLTRWEEQVGRARDGHGRFPGAASIAERHGYLDRPIVDELALDLREWLQSLRPSWSPARSRFTVALSHDIDQVRPFVDTSMALRSALGDIVRRRSPARAVKTVRLFPAQFSRRRIAMSPAFAGLGRLSELDVGPQLTEGLDRAGRRPPSHFYFMTDPHEARGPDYDLFAPEIQSVLARLSDRGHIIGLHGGYTTLGDRERLIAQTGRLRDALKAAGCEQTPDMLGGRQHFLRFRAPDTWRDYAAAGLSHEASLGFADLEGFRAGTAHAYRPFDFGADDELMVEARPLIAMDVTLRDYRGYTPSAAVARVEELATRCRAVGGTFTLLWHNTSLNREWAAWGPAYAVMLSRLADLVEGAGRG